MGVHRDERIDLEDGVARGIGFRPADIGLPVDHLTLEIRFVNLIELDDADRSDPGCREVEQRRGTESTRADHQHLGVLQTLLPVDTEVGDDQVPAVSGDLVAGQFGSGFDQWRQR